MFPDKHKIAFFAFKICTGEYILCSFGLCVPKLYFHLNLKWHCLHLNRIQDPLKTLEDAWINQNLCFFFLIPIFTIYTIYIIYTIYTMDTMYTKYTIPKCTPIYIHPPSRARRAHRHPTPNKDYFFPNFLLFSDEILCHLANQHFCSSFWHAAVTGSRPL